MNHLFQAGALAAALALAPAASAADDHLTETRTVNAGAQRVRLDGAIDLHLRQGAVPSLVISGGRRALNAVTTEQQGDTISIGGPVRGARARAELTLPSLREVASDSLGSTEVSGFAGDELDLSLEGAGSMKVNCTYRIVSASLGGVGSLDFQGVASEGVEVELRGAGYARLSGRAQWLRASLGGLGGLDAQHFQADKVNVDLSGLGSATVTARQSANLRLSGMGSVTVYGKPASRNVSVEGLGKVSWK